MTASLLVSPTIGIIAGGILGPVIGLVVPPAAGKDGKDGQDGPGGTGLPKLEDMHP